MNREVTSWKTDILIGVAFFFDTLGFIFDLVPIANFILVPIVDLFAFLTLWAMMMFFLPTWAIQTAFYSGRGLGKTAITAAAKLIPIFGGLIPAWTIWTFSLGIELRKEQRERTKKQSTAKMKPLRASAVY